MKTAYKRKEKARVCLVKSKRNYYTIGEMAHLCDINPKTLRYYDQIDLIKPSYKSDETGYRYYSKEQAFTIYTIKKLQQLEFSLKEIKTLIQSDSLDLYEKAIGNKISFLDQKIEALNKTRNEGKMLLNKVSNSKDYYQTGSGEQDKFPGMDSGNMTVSIEEIPKQTVFYTTGQMQNYNNFEISIERWFEIYHMAEKSSYLPVGHVILHYLTDSVMDQFYKSQIKLEVQLPIQVDPANTVQIAHNAKDPHIKEIGGYKAAVFYHYGKYETIYQSHLNVLRWIDGHGYKVSGYLSEEYLISPFDLKSGENYLTKIIYPVCRQ